MSSFSPNQHILCHFNNHSFANPLNSLMSLSLSVVLLGNPQLCVNSTPYFLLIKLITYRAQVCIQRGLATLQPFSWMGQVLTSSLRSLCVIFLLKLQTPPPLLLLQLVTSLAISMKKKWSHWQEFLHCLLLNPHCCLSPFLPFMAASPCFCGRLISLHCTLKPIPSCFSKFFSPTRISSLLDHCHQHAPILKKRPIIFGLTYLSHYCSISWFFTAKLTETIFAHIRCLQFLNLL